jgi:hypothetical protein
VSAELASPAFANGAASAGGGLTAELLTDIAGSEFADCCGAGCDAFTDVLPPGTVRDCAPLVLGVAVSDDPQPDAQIAASTARIITL